MNDYYNARMSLTKEQRWEKRNWFLFVIGYFAIGYLLTNRFNEARSHYYDVSFPFEADIPFIPLFIFGYLCVYAAILMVYFFADDIQLWRRTVASHLVLITVSYVIFLAFPVMVTIRPAPDAMPQGNVIDALIRGYFFIDRPTNAFPSLHVAFPILGTLLMWRSRPVGRWVLLAMAVLTAVSVILVKQHYLLDILAGVLVAVSTYTAVTIAEEWKSRLSVAQTFE